MNLLVWNEEFSIGNKIMDYQRKYLLILLNDLIFNLNSSEEEKNKKFRTWLRYLILHFRFEEEYFCEIPKEKVKLHILNHKNFIEKLLVIENYLFIKDKRDSKELMIFLLDWLNYHSIQDSEVFNII